MAGFLPKDLVGLAATPGTDDIFIVEVDGESEVKKVTYGEMLPTGVAGGFCPLDENNFVPSIHLPSYVDDVIEATDLASLPTTGETGKIYVAQDTNKTYRWSGSAYVEIGSGLYASDIGVLIQGYDANIVSDASYVHTDNNYTTVEKTKLGNALVSTDIGTTVQGYNINTVVDASYVHTDNNFTSALKTNYDTAYSHSISAHAPTDADNTAANETPHTNVVVDASYVHTDNNYTTAEKTKLGTVEDNATADQTGAEIKTAYEAEADTNAFTDAEKTKLGTAVVSTDIGTTVQGYDANTVVDSSYLSHTIASAVADITVDGTETTAGNANKINELLASLRTAGILAT